MNPESTIREFLSPWTNIRVIKNKKTRPLSEPGFVYQFKHNRSHHNLRYRYSIQTVVERWVSPITPAQLNCLESFNVDANLASPIVRVWLLFHR